MFKRFNVPDDIASTNQLKNSAQRGIQSQILESYPALEPIIDEILPKKSMVICKCLETVQLLLINNEPLFFSERDGPWYPNLKLLHKYPGMMDRMQVDRGAVKFILGGANIMCPGFTSPGGALPVPIEAHKPVAIYVEGKQHAIAVGLTTMSTADIAAVNKGVAVESKHYLNDALWHVNRID